MYRLYLTLAVLLTAVLAGCGTPYQFKGRELDPPEPVADWTLTDHYGQSFALGPQSDQITVLYFGYTRCPDFCPTTMGTWKQVRQQLGADADKVRFVMISVDPEHDTEAVLSDYLGRFDPAILGVRPTPEQLTDLGREYGVALNDHAGQHSAAMHGTYMYVLDAQGQWRLLYGSDADAEALTADLKHLLKSS